MDEGASEREELHFLAALTEELMRALLEGGLMNREQLQAIEDAVSERTGSKPRIW